MIRAFRPYTTIQHLKLSASRTRKVDCDEAEISLMGDAVVLMRDEVIGSVLPVGWPPLSELFEAVVKHKVPIFV